jgi:anti-sigma factor RsiW
MRCEDLLHMLNDYVDGDIDPSLCEGFEHHLEDCDPCQVVVDTIRKTITLYKQEEVYEIPMVFRERLHQVLREHWRDGDKP